MVALPVGRPLAAELTGETPALRITGGRGMPCPYSAISAPAPDFDPGISAVNDLL